MSATPWTPLSAVDWTSPPLATLVVSRAFLRSRFGPPQLANLDSNGVGLFDAWLMRFECGLEVAVWGFHDRDVGEIHASDTERRHIFFHLDLDRAKASVWWPDYGHDAPPRWRVVRADDNGNEFEVRVVPSRCEAEHVAAVFEARGHKQTYWVTQCA